MYIQNQNAFTNKPKIYTYIHAKAIKHNYTYFSVSLIYHW